MLPDNYRKMKSTNGISFASIHDVHWYHNNTPTWLIGENLDRYLLNDEMLSQLTHLFIPGDLFDKPKFAYDEHVQQGTANIHRMLTMCAKHNVKIFILEGTPSHDAGQSVQLVTYNEVNKIGCYVKYVDKLDVIIDDGVVFGFVPDEWHHDPQVTYSQMLKKMKLVGVDKLDFCLMHGCFERQLPPHVPHPSHDSEQWQAIVNYYILIAHHHIQNSWGKIRVSGSFDRIAHGEESPKGFYCGYVNFDTGEKDTVFIENRTAMQYLTLDVDEYDDYLTAYKAVKELCDTITKVKPARLRLSSPSKTIDVKAMRGSLMVEYEHIGFDIKDVKSKSDDHITQRILEQPDEDQYQSTVCYNKDNTLTAFRDHLNRMQVCPEEAENMLIELEELL